MATVWINKYLSNTWEVLQLVRAASRPGEFRLLCTHPRALYPGREHCDLFEQEPDGLREDAYVDYCLDFARRHRVELFLPGRNVLPIARAAQRFEAAGMRVLATGDAPTIERLNHKGAVYVALGQHDIAIPEHEVVNNLADFDAAWERLRPRHDLLCYKPAVSVYGIGFRIVGDRGGAAAQLRAHNPFFVSHDQARRELGAKAPFRDLLVMQYLPGHERSVDCLARDGELIACVVRRKEDGGQVLEDNPALVATVRRLTAALRLSNLYNVQFRDAGGRPYLLEINPRMSGGLPFACQSGLVLPLWALRLALGTEMPDDVPAPRAGVWVPQPEPVSSL